MADNKKQEKMSWLVGVFTGWGLKEVWAKLLAGAILGALGALGVLSMDSCSGHYTQSASGDVAAKWYIVPIPVETDNTK